VALSMGGAHQHAFEYNCVHGTELLLVLLAVILEIEGECEVGPSAQTARRGGGVHMAWWRGRRVHRARMLSGEGERSERERGGGQAGDADATEQDTN
jgi:hypothetical protein